MMQALRNFWAWLKGREVELRLGLRVSVAGVGAYLLAALLDLPQGYWAVFSAVIVMQASVGGSVKATMDRLVGTLGGAVIGGVAAMFAMHGSTTTVAIALAAALVPVGFLAGVDARFRIAPVTAAIVLVSPFGHDATPFWFTVDRVLEIALGSIVALAVSVLILPGRAHSMLTDGAGKLLRLLGDFLVTALAAATEPGDGADLRRLQIATRRTLVTLDAAADEARRERSAHLTGAPDPEPVARTAMRIRNDLILIARATIEPLPSPFRERLGPSLEELSRAGSALLRDLARAFETRAEPPSLDAFDTALRAYRENVAALRAEGATRGFDAGVLGRLFSLGFGLDQLRQNVGDMVNRAGELALKKTPPQAG